MTILVNVNIQFVDESGKPFAAGLYYFGDPDVDPVANPKSVFSDPALSIALPNPQVLDARGAFQQPIYRPSSDYSHKLDDVLANQIFLVSNDSGQQATASDRIQDNANDTTLLDDLLNPALILTSKNNVNPDFAGTRLLHNTDTFLLGDDINTTLFDTDGVIVFDATTTETLINAGGVKVFDATASLTDILFGGVVVFDAVAAQTTIGVSGNLTPVRITSVRTQIFGPGSSIEGLIVEATETFLGAFVNPKAIEVTAQETIIRAPGDTGTQRGLFIRATQATLGLNDIAFVDCTTTALTLKNQADAIVLLANANETSISGPSNADAIDITANSTVVRSTGAVTIQTGGTGALNLTSGTGTGPINITSGSGVININDNIVFPTNRSLTTTTGFLNLVAPIGTIQLSASSDITLSASAGDITMNVNVLFKIESKTSAAGTIPFTIDKDSAENENNDIFIQFVRNNSTQLAGGILVSSLELPDFFADSDRRLKSNFAPVQNMLAKIRNVPVYLGDKLSNPETGAVSNGRYWIADEMAAEFPEKVIGDPDAVDGEGKPIYQAVRLGASIELWAALSEAAALIEDLEYRISSLEEAA